MIIIGSNTTSIYSLKQYLYQQFETKDLKPFSYFLGLEVSFTIDGNYLSKANYASNSLDYARLSDRVIMMASERVLERNNRLISTWSRAIKDRRRMLP